MDEVEHNEVEHNEDGRPLSQLFYDDLWKVIKKFESSGLTNAESIGVFEMIKHDQLASIDKESKEDY